MRAASASAGEVQVDHHGPNRGDDDVLRPPVVGAVDLARDLRLRVGPDEVVDQAE